MIAQIRGKVIEKTPTYVVIDCNGVGYKMHISLHTYSSIDSEECTLLTHLSVKEDSHTLFGFYHENERNLFRELIFRNHDFCGFFEKKISAIFIKNRCQEHLTF